MTILIHDNFFTIDVKKIDRRNFNESLSGLGV